MFRCKKCGGLFHEFDYFREYGYESYCNECGGALEAEAMRRSIAAHERKHRPRYPRGGCFGLVVVVIALLILAVHC